jgi:hypothetical protein
VARRVLVETIGVDLIRRDVGELGAFKEEGKTIEGKIVVDFEGRS